ncbi:hypothetical protein SCLCIDRAFT_136639 [Scleroderma citrinum Foug A]|uniref:hAT-like transposase RNase-H fold domain-containing protein n=1 Tax=Scleroderma citrinum Foug A TaxID=1036808 RepID=A0A0C3DDS3_9AGAM|nr:hypothetical protein SCLCIDRAFT_136639 [Scleroderma citrinum Foug A]
MRSLSFAIIRSTTKALPRWQHRCTKAGLKPNLIPHDVVTRWNSSCDLLEFVVRYRKPISKITCDKKLGQLHKYHLSAEEWSVIEELVTHYKSVTMFFSRDATNIAAVIPAMDKLDDHLKSIQSTQEQFHPSILAAMKLARKKMDRYWKRTDESDVYRIAMGLCPNMDGIQP